MVLRTCAECGGPCDGTVTALDEMTGTDVAVCVTCAPMLALAGNIDPSLPGHGDMGRCTAEAPCGDSGCDRCVPANPEWWERAIAGLCSHGGHGWDGETCSDAPEGSV